jgi:hypothetical protein
MFPGAKPAVGLEDVVALPPLPCPSGSFWNDVTCVCATADAGDVPDDMSADRDSSPNSMAASGLG